MKPQPAFDAYAEGYDSAFTQTHIGRLQRQQVWQALQSYLTSPKDILEVNCGTGVDAIQLAQAGHRVLATDLSEKMIEVARAKMLQLDQSIKLRFETSDFLELPTTVGHKKFDCVFSNFGGLNCINTADTMEFSRICYDLLRPGGMLFLIYMSKDCTWERFYFSYQKNKEKANRRKTNGPVTSLVEGHPVSVWYYSTTELETLYSKYFKMVDQFPVGLFVPPSYLEPLFTKRKFLLQALGGMDRLLRFKAWADYGDHVGIVLQRR